MKTFAAWDFNRKVSQLVTLSLQIKSYNNLNFRTHTMLGPNPKKAATPSTATSLSSASSTSGNDVSYGDGLMVKAIDDIFKFVENSENPQEFRVSNLFINFVYKACCLGGSKRDRKKFPSEKVEIDHLDCKKI